MTVSQLSRVARTVSLISGPKVACSRRSRKISKKPRLWNLRSLATFRFSRVPLTITDARGFQADWKLDQQGILNPSNRFEVFMISFTRWRKPALIKIANTVGGFYVHCIYSNASGSYRRQFRFLFLCPLSVECYWFLLFDFSRRLVSLSETDHEWNDKAKFDSLQTLKLATSCFAWADP